MLPLTPLHLLTLILSLTYPTLSTSENTNADALSTLQPEISTSQPSHIHTHTEGHVSLNLARATEDTIRAKDNLHSLSGPLHVPQPPPSQSRLDKIKSMYAWEGFVYDIEACKTLPELLRDFTKIRATGARNVITFDYCGSGADVGYYDDVITAAGIADLNIIPLVWTLPIHPVGQNYTANDTFLIKSVPRIKAVTEAVIRNPGPVLAVALGDEPLFDNDAGSADALASYIIQMKESFRSAGLHDMPVSISDLAFGWQSSGNITSVADAVDFFMINNFPYFAFDAQGGFSNTSWNDFLNDIAYFESIANGRPLLVTQTGWPSNEDTFAPNSPDVIANVSSEQGFWDLLDSHCEDYFKPNNIGWMWRSWDDSIDGWGALYLNGTRKWALSARLTC